jgi:hypothetical protein
MSQAGQNSAGGGGGGTLSQLTPDSGGAVLSIAGNINISGIGGLTTRNAGAATLSIDDKRWTTQFVVDPSSTPGSDAEFTTITAAVAAASAAGGGTVFARTGTYTESFSLPPGVALVSYASIPTAFGPSVGAIVDGTITISGAGEMIIDGISLSNSSGASALDFPGTNGILCKISNCFITGGSTAAITSENRSANAFFTNSFIVGTTDFINSTGSSVAFQSCSFLNLGGSPALIFNGSDARAEFQYCHTDGPFILTNGSQISCANVDANSASVADSQMMAFGTSFNSSSGPAIITTGSASAKLLQSTFSSSGSEAINIGVGTNITLDQGSITSNGGTFAVAGTGSLSYGLLEFYDGISTLDPGLFISTLPVKPLASTSFPGLASFNPSEFTVDSAGEVSLVGGSTLWTDESATFSANVQNGYFITGGSPTCELPPNLSFPAAVIQGQTVHFAVNFPGSTVVLQAATGQTINLGTLSSSTGGTMTSTLFGDSVTLVFRTADQAWVATSFIGTWTAT